jgi:tRNA pseudouridine38-40 synthase
MQEQSPYQHKYKITLAYEGTCYSGWQIQPNGISIQELLQQKLQLLTKEATHVIGAGRTDAGVHALGQVAHFATAAPIDPGKVRHGLNGMLPKDIRVESVEEVPMAFHARYSAVGKMYHYHLHLDPVESPFFRRYRWHLHQAINISLLKEAATLFVGTHDFTTFSNEAHRGPASRSAVRTIQNIEIVPQDGGIRLEFSGNGFLYKMVRNIVGTLVEVGTGKRLPSEIPKLFQQKDRTKAGKAAPAHGLFLVSVEY